MQLVSQGLTQFKVFSELLDLLFEFSYPCVICTYKTMTDYRLRALNRKICVYDVLSSGI